jgi:uncharacterized cupredoxin-like copper-binding protein
MKEGETVRFMVRNAGKIRHEMVLGSLDELKEHAKEMRANPGMVHSEPNQVNLKPGQRGTMVWQFTQPGKVDFACTEPDTLKPAWPGKSRLLTELILQVFLNPHRLFLQRSS